MGGGGQHKHRRRRGHIVTSILNGSFFTFCGIQKTTIECLKHGWFNIRDRTKEVLPNVCCDFTQFNHERASLMPKQTKLFCNLKNNDS
jgi:hypothetical protein